MNNSIFNSELVTVYKRLLWDICCLLKLQFVIFKDFRNFLDMTK